MRTTGDENTEVDRIREVIRLLMLALDNCNKLLVQAEEANQSSGQDNAPQLKRPSAEHSTLAGSGSSLPGPCAALPRGAGDAPLVHPKG